MKNFLLAIDVFFLLRPLLLIPVWGFCIFGYHQGRSFSGGAHFAPLWTTESLGHFAWMVVFSLSVASVHVLNQLADMQVDNANRGLPLLAKGKISPKAAVISAVLCAGAGVTIPAFVHPLLSLCSCLAVCIGYFYSFKPMRFSGRVGLDFLANATGYGIVAFGAGWHLAGAPLEAAVFFPSALPYFLLMCAGSISSTIPDYSGDKLFGKNTTAVVLGVMKAHIAATFFLSLSIATAWMAHQWIALTCGLCAYPFYIFYFIRRDSRIMEATYKVGGFLCMAAAAAIMPVFALTSIAITGLTFVYFKKRHGITYPSLVQGVHDE
jgi:4-hydroxybenzoate polyprenyltransferase